MTPSNEYLKALDKSVTDLSERVERRDLLNAEIAGLRETVRVLSSRVTLTEEQERKIAQLLAVVDYATPNLTDAIKSLLTKAHPKALTAVDVRNALEESGFNFDDFSNSLSACHAALKRLSPEEVETNKNIEGKTTYKRVLPRIASPRDYMTIGKIGWDGASALLPTPNLDALTGEPENANAVMRRAFGRPNKTLGQKIGDGLFGDGKKK